MHTSLSRDKLCCYPKGKRFQSRCQNFRDLKLCCDEINEDVDERKARGVRNEKKEEKRN
jgi:hypothetical protein